MINNSSLFSFLSLLSLSLSLSLSLLRRLCVLVAAERLQRSCCVHHCRSLAQELLFIPLVSSLSLSSSSSAPPAAMEAFALLSSGMRFTKKSKPASFNTPQQGSSENAEVRLRPAPHPLLRLSAAPQPLQLASPLALLCPAGSSNSGRPAGLFCGDIHRRRSRQAKGPSGGHPGRVLLALAPRLATAPDALHSNRARSIGQAQQVGQCAQQKQKVEAKRSAGGTLE